MDEKKLKVISIRHSLVLILFIGQSFDFYSSLSAVQSWFVFYSRYLHLCKACGCFTAPLVTWHLGSVQSSCVYVCTFTLYGKKYWRVIIKNTRIHRRCLHTHAHNQTWKHSSYVCSVCKHKHRTILISRTEASRFSHVGYVQAIGCIIQVCIFVILRVNPT